jgi:hypothetical protein
LHPKVRNLAVTLGLPLYAAVGVLEMLWHFTAAYAPRGDVGRYDDQAIALAVTWDRLPAELVDALRHHGLVTPDPEHRLVIHDWHHHANQDVRRKLTRRGTWFIGQRKPIGKAPSYALGMPRRRLASRARARLHMSLPPGAQQEGGASPLVDVDVNSSSPQQPPSMPQSATATREGFVAFWKAYPARRGRKDGKQAALDQWMRLRPDAAFLGRILMAVASYAKDNELPLDAERWLKRRRWEDEATFIADLEPPAPAPKLERPADGGAIARLRRAGMLDVGQKIPGGSK